MDSQVDNRSSPRVSSEKEMGSENTNGEKGVESPQLMNKHDLDSQNHSQEQVKVEDKTLPRSENDPEMASLEIQDENLSPSTVVEHREDAIEQPMNSEKDLQQKDSSLEQILAPVTPEEGNEMYCDGDIEDEEHEFVSPKLSPRIADKEELHYQQLQELLDSNELIDTDKQEMIDTLILPQLSSQLPNSRKMYQRDDQYEEHIDFEMLMKEKQVLLYELQREKDDSADLHEMYDVLNFDHVQMKDDITVKLKDAEDKGERLAYERFMGINLSLEEKCNQLQSELLSKDEDHKLIETDLRSKLELQEQENKSLRDKCAELEAAIKDHEKETNFKESYTLLDIEFKELKAKFEEGEQCRKTLEKKCSASQVKLEKEEANRKSLEKKYSTLESTLAKKNKVKLALEKKNSDLIRVINRKEDDHKLLKSKCSKLKINLDREEESNKSLERKCSRLKSDLDKEDENKKLLEKKCSELRSELERKDGKTSLDWSADLDPEDCSSEHVISTSGPCEHSEKEKSAEIELEQTKQQLDVQAEQMNVLHADNERLVRERNEIQRNYEMVLVDFHSYQMQCDGTMKNLKNEVINDLNIMVNNIMVNNMATIEGHCGEYEQI